MHWLNNFCEDLTNSSNPRYCGGPVQTQTYLTINQQEFAQQKEFDQQMMFDELRKNRDDWVAGLRDTISDRKY